MSSRRHQPHAIVNANKRLRVAGGAGGDPRDSQPTVNISTPHNVDPTVHEIDGRLTLVQERLFQWKVPFTDREPEFDLDAVRNDVNQLGPIHEFEVPIVTNNDPVSYRAAVNKRSNFLQDGPDDDIEDLALAQALAIVKELPDLFDTWDDNDQDREEWLAKFDKGKQARMIEAWNQVDYADLRDITIKTGSVKREVLLGKRYDKEAAGRIIYAGSDVFNAVTGPAMSVAMTRLVELLSHVDHTGKEVRLGEVMIKLGYKAQDTDLAAFVKDERYPDIVEGDFSRNDREQRSKVAIICDAWMEKVGMPAWYRALLFELEHYELVNYEFGLRVNLSYQLATGTTNTTFRNSIYNATMFAVCCRRQRRQGKALVLGDDLLACLDHRLDLKAWVSDVATFKMVLKAKAPRLDGEATFLSRRIFANVATPFMIPCPEKAYFRFNCRANPNQSMTDDQYICAKALSYAFSFRHVHELRDIFLRRFHLNGGHMSFDIEEIGWNNRQFGYTVKDIYDRTCKSDNLVDLCDFSEWVSDLYQDIDGGDLLELFEDMIVSNDCVVLDDPRAASFAALVG